jgi:hypothetical protein
MRVLLFLGLIIWSRQAALVLIFCGFAAGSFCKWLYYKLVPRGSLALRPRPAAQYHGG